VIGFHQLLLEFNARVQWDLGQAPEKVDSRQRGGGQKRQTEEGGGSFNCWVQCCSLWGEMGVLMHRDKPDRAPLCVLNTDQPIQSQTTHLDIFYITLFDLCYLIVFSLCVYDHVLYIEICFRRYNDKA